MAVTLLLKSNFNEMSNLFYSSPPSGLLIMNFVSVEDYGVLHCSTVVVILSCDEEKLHNLNIDFVTINVEAITIHWTLLPMLNC